MSILLAPCGIDCTQCDAYIAAQTDNSEMRSVMADNYEKKFGKSIDPDSLNCDGCLAQGRKINFCAQCSIRNCATGKGFVTCAECAEFPCEKGSFIWTTNSKSRETLELLKNNR